MPSFVPPTPDQVDEVVARLASPQLARYFFSKLENPLWIRALHDRGVFGDPPEVQETHAGTISFPQWPQSQYLARMASVAADDVVEILAAIQTDNPSVNADILDAARAVPLKDQKKPLTKCVCAAIDRSKYWIHTTDAVELAILLARSGERGAGLDLAERLFARALREAHSPHKGYCTVDELAPLVPVFAEMLPSVLLPKLCEWLMAAIESHRNFSAATGMDYSYIWRPAIEDHEDNNDADAASATITLVRQGFEAAIAGGTTTLESALELLAARPHSAFRRLGIHLISAFGDRMPSLVSQALLSERCFDDFEAKHEYAVLLRRRFSCLTEDQKQQWLARVDAGPDMEGYTEAMRTNSGREPTDADRQARVDWWRFERLYLVRECLEGQRRDFCERMLAERGDPEIADVPPTWGHASPFSATELDSMSFEEVFNTASNWRPSESQRRRGVTMEGLASAFEGFVDRHTVDCANSARLLKGRPPVLVRRFLHAIGQGVRDGKDIDVDAAIELCSWVVEQPLQVNAPDSNQFEGLVESHWRWARLEVVQLLEYLCGSQRGVAGAEALKHKRSAIWTMIEQLCAEPTEASIVHDASTEDPRRTDYLFLGINSPRGRAVNAALEYARWIARSLVQVTDGVEHLPGGFDTMPEVRSLLESQIQKGKRGREVMSVLGAKLGLVHWIDPGWFTSKAPDIFRLESIGVGGSDCDGWAAWNAFLVWGRPSALLFQALRSQYACAVEQTAKVEPPPGDSRERPCARLAEHLMLLYGWGHIDLSDPASPLHRLMRNGPPSLREHALAFAGRGLQGETDVPPAVIDRLVALWEFCWKHRTLERDQGQSWSAAFGPWFSSRRFAADWSMATLRDVVALSPAVNDASDVVKELASRVASEPGATIEVLCKMVRAETRSWQLHRWASSMEMIIRSAVQAGGGAREAAVLLVDHLARRGYQRFVSLLQ
ncbi:MAG: hypothetical protein JNL50_13765 [Phycisphaerae bacterium]|nr:hypothetical protein [Phycisphaerae bacterium]